MSAEQQAVLGYSLKVLLSSVVGQYSSFNAHLNQIRVPVEFRQGYLRRERWLILTAATHFVCIVD